MFFFGKKEYRLKAKKIKRLKAKKGGVKRLWKAMLDVRYSIFNFQCKAVLDAQVKRVKRVAVFSV